jgi:hypothetical protein
MAAVGANRDHAGLGIGKMMAIGRSASATKSARSVRFFIALPFAPIAQWTMGNDVLCIPPNPQQRKRKAHA